MVKKRTGPDSIRSHPLLLVPKAEAAQKMMLQIGKGHKIRDTHIYSQAELDAAEDERTKWDSYNAELLQRLFDDTAIADEYKSFDGFIIPGDADFDHWVKDFRRGMGASLTRLEAILGRLDLIPERTTGTAVNHRANTSEEESLGSDIFVVHGHDDGAKLSTARFIEQLGLHPVVLHEQPSSGRTIIEKFEYYANVGFAVVLLTPDDSCSSAGAPVPTKMRARQNVIFELGFFVGKLGRKRVCALYKDGVEIPSDFQGVLFVPMDAHEGWHLKLAKEIKAAGIEVDLNRVM